jgi:hypothetical protein
MNVSWALMLKKRSNSENVDLRLGLVEQEDGKQQKQQQGQRERESERFHGCLFNFGGSLK